MLKSLILLFSIAFTPLMNFNFKTVKEEVKQTTKLLKAPETLEELRAADPLEIAKLDKYDSRKYDIDTFIKKQTLNICWAYSTLSASETSILREGLYQNDMRSLDLSELNHTYAVHNNNQSLDPLNLTIGDYYSGGYDRGYHLYGSAQRMLSWVSPSLEDYYEYKPSFKESAYLLEDIIIVDSKDRDDIKRAIARYGAVTVVYKINDWHEDYFYYNGNIDVVDGDIHAVTIVGWDDTVDKNLYKLPSTLDGGWIVKNSWGTAHAEGDGYFMMSYDTPITDTYAFDFASKEKYDYNYHYDGFVDKDDTLIDNNETAAIFPVKKSSIKNQEYLKAINVSILDTESPKNNKEATIVAKIYTDVSADEGDIYSSKNNPINKEKGPIATVSRKVTHEGSYTLELPEEVELNKGEYFSVVVDVISENDKYKVALSKEATTSNNDLTFYKDSSGKWINCGTPNGRNVARIKAFTKTKPRVGDIKKDLVFTEMNIDPNFKPRYNQIPEKVDVTVSSDGVILNEDEDYILEPLQIDIIPNLTETTSDNDAVAIGSFKAIGKGEWTGENKVTFPILVGFHDLTKLGEVQVDNTIKIKVDGYHEKYSDIALPDGWEFLYKEDKLNVGLNTGNYIDYKSSDKECYRRNMFPVVIEKTSEKPDKIDIKNSKISVKSSYFVFNGHEHKPEIEVSINDETLILGTDYNVNYLNNINAGKATIKVIGIGKYAGFNETTFDILSKDISITKIEFEDRFEYDGQIKTPVVNLTLNNYKLIKDVDFIVSYENNLNAGEGKIILRGINNFKGEIFKTFIISRAKNELISFEILNNTPVASFKYGEPIYRYYLDEECLNEISKPNEPGVYYVKAFVLETQNYEGFSSHALSIKIEETTKPEPNPEPENPDKPNNPETPETPEEDGNEALTLTLIIGASVIGGLIALTFILVIIFRLKK